MQPVRLPVSRLRETGSPTGCIAASRGREGPQTLNCLKPFPAGGGLVLRVLVRDSLAGGGDVLCLVCVHHQLDI